MCWSLWPLKLESPTWTLIQPNSGFLLAVNKSLKDYGSDAFLVDISRWNPGWRRKLFLSAKYSRSPHKRAHTHTYIWIVRFLCAIIEVSAKAT